MRCIQSCARLTIAVCYLSCHVPADFIRNRRLLCCAALRCKSGDLLLFGGRVWLQPIAKGWLWPQGQEGQPIIWLSHVCAAARKRYCAAPRHPLLQQQESSGASSVSRTRTQTTLCIPDTICTAHGMGWTTSHINTRADGGATNGSTVTSTDGMHVCLLSTLKKTPPPPTPPQKCCASLQSLAAPNKQLCRTSSQPARQWQYTGGGGSSGMRPRSKLGASHGSAAPSRWPPPRPWPPRRRRQAWAAAAAGRAQALVRAPPPAGRQRAAGRRACSRTASPQPGRPPRGAARTQERRLPAAACQMPPAGAPARAPRHLHGHAAFVLYRPEHAWLPPCRSPPR